jgi:radical SAM protein with 4Fe4S-binding SPASM domain
MDEKLFVKIIDEFIDTDEERGIDFSSNNEPLLDDRIIDFIEYTRKQLGKRTNIFLHMFTNGTLLTEEKFLRLANLLDGLQIDNYNDKLKLIKPVKNILDKYKLFPFHAEIIIAVRKVNEVLLNRAGISPNYKDINYTLIDSPCKLPFGQMVVRPDGKVSLCCADVYGAYTMGDLNKDNIETIWNNLNYNNLRNLMKKGRNNIELLCRKCNAIYSEF